MERKMTEEEVIKKYEPLIYKAAYGAARNAVCNAEDLAQEGKIAALIAYRNYDPRKNASLGTYIRNYVNYYMIEYQKKNASSMSKIAYSTQLVRNIKKEMKEKGVKEEDIYTYLMKHGRIKEAKEIARSKSAFVDSLDNMTQESSDFNNGIEACQDRLFLEQLMSKCTLDEKKVIQMRFGFTETGIPLTIQQIADKQHCSFANIYKINNTALNKIKKYAKREEAG